VTAPLVLVEDELNFDKNPRLANGRGFFCAPAAEGPATTNDTYDED
jgi:hypothetical protein